MILQVQIVRTLHPILHQLFCHNDKILNEQYQVKDPIFHGVSERNWYHLGETLV